MNGKLLADFIDIIILAAKLLLMRMRLENVFISLHKFAQILSFDE